MITIEKEICGNPPSLQTYRTKTCDECGTICNGIFKDGQLWKYGDQELCFTCLWEALTDDGIVTVIE